MAVGKKKAAKRPHRPVLEKGAPDFVQGVDADEPLWLPPHGRKNFYEEKYATPSPLIGDHFAATEPNRGSSDDRHRSELFENVRLLAEEFARNAKTVLVARIAEEAVSSNRILSDSEIFEVGEHFTRELRNILEHELRSAVPRQGCVESPDSPNAVAEAKRRKTLANRCRNLAAYASRLAGRIEGDDQRFAFYVDAPLPYERAEVQLDTIDSWLNATEKDRGDRYLTLAFNANTPDRKRKLLVANALTGAALLAMILRRGSILPRAEFNDFVEHVAASQNCSTGQAWDVLAVVPESMRVRLLSVGIAGAALRPLELVLRQHSPSTPEAIDAMSQCIVAIYRSRSSAKVKSRPHATVEYAGIAKGAGVWEKVRLLLLSLGIPAPKTPASMEKMMTAAGKLVDVPTNFDELFPDLSSQSAVAKS